MILLALNFAQTIFKVDVVDLYTKRFIEGGDALETAEGDARFEVYKEGFDIVKGNEILGTGISTFADLNKHGFSNAHNIFVNIFVERGIIGLVLMFILFYYIL